MMRKELNNEEKRFPKLVQTARTQVGIKEETKSLDIFQLLLF